MTIKPKTHLLGGISWRQPLVCAVATGVCTVLAIWAVVAAPVAPAPGVSGLYLAAALYVPVALWFGVWGSIAGYLSCVFMGIYTGLPLEFVLVWALADFFEGFIPLMIYRRFKIKKAKLRKPKLTYALSAFLVADLIVSALAASSAWSTVFYATFFAGIGALAVQAVVEDHKTWVTWLVVCVFVASLFSGIFGVGALAAFGSIPWAIFPEVFFGWVFGDIIVLATLGTVVTIVLTPLVMKSKAYVRGYFS